MDSKLNKMLCTLASTLALSLSGIPSFAEVIKQDTAQLVGETNKSIYEWRDADIPVKGVVVTIHGASLHGGVFDALGRYLASEGYVVISPDLMGHGRRHYDKTCGNYSPVADYVKAEPDLLETLKEVRATFPTQKIFWFGESLGSNYAVRLAAKNPTLVDGLILSAPTIKRHHSTPVKLAMDMAVNTIVEPNKQLSLKKYAERYIADDPLITKDYLADPLMRKTLSPEELFSCRRLIKSTLPLAGDVASNIPVIVFQGTQDKMVQAAGAEEVMSFMKSKDRTLHWAENRGHLLFMTSHLQPDLEVAVDRWLDSHLEKPEVYTTASETSNNTPRGAVSN